MHLQSQTENLVELDIDHNEAFDYENADKARYTVQDLKGMLCDEIVAINSQGGQ